MARKKAQVGMDYILAIAIGVFIVFGVAMFLFRAEISETLSGLFSDFGKEKKASSSAGTRIGSAEEKAAEIKVALDSNNLGLAEMKYGEFIGEYFNEAEFGSLKKQAELSQNEMIKMKNEYLEMKHSAVFNRIKKEFSVVPFSNGKYEIRRIGNVGAGESGGA